MSRKFFLTYFLYCFVTALLIITAAGILVSLGIYEKSYNKLEDYLYSYAESDLSRSISEAMISNADDEDKYSMVNSLISSYKGKISDYENKKIYLLNSQDLKVIYPLSILGETINQTENIERALKGEEGKINKLYDDYMDCAYSIDYGSGGCILYVRDNKADFRAEIYYLLKYLFLALAISFILSLVLAYIIFKRVTYPIKKITKRAEELGRGELYERISDAKYGEFNELFAAINNMGLLISKSIKRMNSDKHRVEVIIENINNGIITFESDGRVVQINSAAKNILRINDEKDMNFDELFKKLGTDVRLAEFMFFGKSAIIEREIKKGDSYLKIWFIPYKPEGGNSAGVVCVFEDVTKQFNVMQTMKKFVADVSHELKTPITVIRSYTETVLNSYLDDKAMAAHLLNIVYEESGKMNELVQNLLDISRYETKEIPFKSEEFSIDEMLVSLKDTFKLEAEKKNLDIKYTRMTDLPLFKGSRSDIERAVKNIISNSIKYTSKGDKIRIYAGRLNNDIYIKVEDTGWGIPESKLGKLFERFYRVEEGSRSRDRGGTGLGLSIAKEIIERHKGKIKIESEYTKYTRVTITLPITEEKKGGKQKGRSI